MLDERRASLQAPVPQDEHQNGYDAEPYSLSEEDRRVLREIPVALRPLESPLDRLDWR